MGSPSNDEKLKACENIQFEKSSIKSQVNLGSSDPSEVYILVKSML